MLLLHDFKTFAATEIVLGYRELPSHTDSDSESKSNNFSDTENSDAEVNDQNHEGHSQRHGNSLVIHLLVCYIKCCLSIKLFPFTLSLMQQTP